MLCSSFEGAYDAVRHVAEGVAACEGSTCARRDGSGGGSVAVLVHRAGEAAGGAKIGGALPVGDHRALAPCGGAHTDSVSFRVATR